MCKWFVDKDGNVLAAHLPVVSGFFDAINELRQDGLSRFVAADVVVHNTIIYSETCEQRAGN